MCFKVGFKGLHISLAWYKIWGFHVADNEECGHLELWHYTWGVDSDKAVLMSTTDDWEWEVTSGYEW
jgi:hypothetical protein